MERDYGYQYDSSARKKPDDNGIEVPYFVTPEYQRLKRERELRGQQLERERYQRELAERERQRREQYKKTGRHTNEIVVQHNNRNARANKSRSKNKLRNFALEMAVIILVSTSVVYGVNAVAKNNNPAEKNSTKTEYSANADDELEPGITTDISDTYLERADEAEEVIHHYELDDLERENLSADKFCNNVDDFLASGEDLIGNNLEEKTWNLLYNQIGCSAEQSAAILGNMLVEDPSLNPFQHQVYEGMSDDSNKAIVNNKLGIGPFQFSGSRKEAFLKFVRNSTEYEDLYEKFATPKNYCATTQAGLFDTNLVRFDLTEEDCDRGLKCAFAYISYEMQYPEDAHYNRNQWNKFTTEDSDEKSDAADLAIKFAEYFERTESGHDNRMTAADNMYSKYFTFGAT